MTIADVLDLPVLRRGVPEVTAGADLLDRPIRWVHAAEVPNIASLLKGGELLLTTGLGLGAGVQEQRATAAALAARGVAGLVLELGATFAAPPAALATACARNELPLIVLHRPVPFVEVTETIHAEIVNNQFALMQRGEELHRRFTDLMLRGAGVPEVLDALAEATGNPVLLRRGDDVIAHAAHGRSRRDLLAALDGHARGLPSAPAALERPVPSGDPERPSGALVLLALDRELDGFAEVALERAVALVGLALIQDRAEETLAHRERGALLGELLRGGVGESEAAARAAAFGFRSETLLPLAVGRRARRVGRLTEDEDARWVQIWRELRRELEHRRTPALLGGVEDQALLVVGLRRGETRAEAAERAARLVRAETERQLGSAGGAVICVGREVTSWSELGAAMEQALEALPAASEVPDRPWHDAAAPDVDRLFASLRGEPALHEFVGARLDAVLAHDRRRAAKLLPTLESYCEHGGQKAATARALGLERPSLYHRIARLETLLGSSLADPDTLLGVHLALRARRTLGDAPR
ncbi:transcriptional regulator, PucR family [Conexibacter woesei DSM 14684]|uniref:Transcriptional regulator, PucR family n=1 Tax=Conexibacter woesei (strain DSM 14684 / CCUG 47730 / CIP 108061 / JCM 11494 / NBRC 100937 / ID131577) TaxID=469383 RepID=D3F5V4_CONWI|nr:transcriptional regulator, PucR family [Conexibacter woesei DSM 14684]